MLGQPTCKGFVEALSGFNTGNRKLQFLEKRLLLLPFRILSALSVILSKIAYV